MREDDQTALLRVFLKRSCSEFCIIRNAVEQIVLSLGRQTIRQFRKRKTRCFSKWLRSQQRRSLLERPLHWRKLREEVRTRVLVSAHRHNAGTPRLIKFATELPRAFR